MKRIICFALAVIMCLALVACGGEKKPQTESTDAYEPTGNAVENEDYFQWSASKATEIVGYTDEGLKQVELVIPAKCTKVQQLNDNQTVKHITFANDDTEISGDTFTNCSSLESIELPKNLKSISDYTFYGCKKLNSVIIPEHVSEIGNNAFLECSSLQTVEFNKEIVSIGRKAFNKCSSLRTISLPDSIEVIEKSAFEDCSSLTELTFGAGLQNVEEAAFQKCVSVKKVILPDGVKSLGIWAFAYCDAIEEIHLPASLETIAVSSIVQTHKFKVFVVEGSYADQSISGLMGVEFYDKQYQ